MMAGEEGWGEDDGDGGWVLAGGGGGTAFGRNKEESGSEVIRVWIGR